MSYPKNMVCQIKQTAVSVISITPNTTRENYSLQVRMVAGHYQHRNYWWPKDNRILYIECNSSADLGRQQKANQGQVDFSKRVIQLPAKPPSGTVAKPVGIRYPSIAVLIPYTRQRESLRFSISGIEVSSIDGFQRRKADIIVFVTVRCNAPRNVDFLNDMRRLNVVITRAKCGVVANNATLAGGGEQRMSWMRVRRLGKGWPRGVRLSKLRQGPHKLARVLAG
jgi:hypothetical protein